MKKKSWVDVLNKGLQFNDFRMLSPRIWSPPKDQKYEFLMREIDTIIFNKQKELDYFAPNLVAIQISIANQSIKKAGRVYRRLSRNLKEKKDTKETLTANLIKRTQLVYKYIELAQTSIVFSFTAVETFLNQSIPDSYIYTEIESKKTIQYNKEQIEKWIPWKTKIKKIIPEIYKIENIHNEPFWNNLIQLAEIRNDIIHQKTSNDTEVFEVFFNKNIVEICFSSNDFLTFMYNKVQSNIESMPNNIMNFPKLDESSELILFKQISEAEPIDL